LRPSRLINRNVVAGRGRTSMRLEPELWDALQEICQRERLSLGELVRRIEQSGHAGGRTSAVRVHLLRYFREAATAEGHRMAGHGSTLPVNPTWRPSAEMAPSSLAGSLPG
jgi:predicted DNA-binding ribbon-helix-helix protein